MCKRTLELLTHLCLYGYIGEINICIEPDKSTVCIGAILNKAFVEKIAQELGCMIVVTLHNNYTCITIINPN